MSEPASPPFDTAAASGPLSGLRVVELAGELSGPAGKLMGDLGADVVVVEPPGGDATRRIGPFAGGVEHPDRSLHWWYHNTSKRGVVLDLESDQGVGGLRRLVADADVVLESADPRLLARRGIDHADLLAEHPRLVWASITPYGRAGEPAPATDLTLLAEGGVVWNCGYDDHALPPVRPAGGHAAQIAAVTAVGSVLTAVLARSVTGRGQHVDVSVHACINVTTEVATFFHLTASQTVQRQAGRHAAPEPTLPVQVQGADGRYVTTGFLPTSQQHLRALVEWLEELGVAEQLPELFFLHMGIERGGVDRASGDVVDLSIRAAARDAQHLLARTLGGYEFFREAQERGLQCGIIYTPDEAFADPHIRARGFPTVLWHEELGREVPYPGAPFRMSETPWRLSRRAPRIGEHTDELLG